MTIRRNYNIKQKATFDNCICAIKHEPIMKLKYQISDYLESCYIREQKNRMPLLCFSPIRLVWNIRFFPKISF